MTAVDAVTEELRERLRAGGFRLTPQRELVLGAVERLGHGTAEELLADVQSRAGAVNQSTVYRTLEVLEQLGLVRHIHLGGRAPTYHSTAGPQHFHLTCRNCQRVLSVDASVAAELTGRLREERGFVVDVGHLTMFGRCADCGDAPVEPAGTTEEPR